MRQLQRLSVTFQVKISSNKTRARTLCCNLRARRAKKKAKIKAIYRFAVMSICWRGPTAFFLLCCFMQRIRKGQASSSMECTLWQSQCQGVSLSLYLSHCIDSFQLHCWHALYAHTLFTLFTRYSYANFACCCSLIIYRTCQEASRVSSQVDWAESVAQKCCNYLCINFPSNFHNFPLSISTFLSNLIVR